jgi:hypothetical protein
VPPPGSINRSAVLRVDRTVVLSRRWKRLGAGELVGSHEGVRVAVSYQLGAPDLISWQSEFTGGGVDDPSIEQVPRSGLLVRPAKPSPQPPVPGSKSKPSSSATSRMAGRQGLRNLSHASRNIRSLLVRRLKDEESALLVEDQTVSRDAVGGQPVRSVSVPDHGRVNHGVSVKGFACGGEGSGCVPSLRWVNCGSGRARPVPRRH